MSKSKNRNIEGKPTYWQTDDYNRACYYANTSMLLSLMVNRFRWTGLPETCDARYLEMKLHQVGTATIFHPVDLANVWYSTSAGAMSQYDIYGRPVKWDAIGFNGERYQVTPQTGEYIYYSQTRANPWSVIVMYATKLTHIQRTEDVNLFQQHLPYVMVAPQEKKLELANILKQQSGFEPAVLGDKSLLDLKENCFTLDTAAPFIGEDLAREWQNVLNEFLLFAGIPHLAFEKGERMIEDEARANSAPTNLNLKDCLDARRYACDNLRRIDPELFEDLYVYYNDDYESYNYNYANNLESVTQDGLISGGADNDSEN